MKGWWSIVITPLCGRAAWTPTFVNAIAQEESDVGALNWYHRYIYKKILEEFESHWSRPQGQRPSVQVNVLLFLMSLCFFMETLYIIHENHSLLVIDLFIFFSWISHAGLCHSEVVIILYNWFNWNMTVIVKQVYVHRRTIRCLSHSSIMCHIISLYTPWPVRICARSEYLDLLYFFDGMSLPVYSTQTWPRLVSCWLWSYALAVILTNPHHLHSRTPPPPSQSYKTVRTWI